MSTGSTKPDICFWPHLLEEGAKEGELVFHNKEGQVTIKNRTFRHDEPIIDFVFSEVFVANRPCARHQTFEFEIDGEIYSYTWDHRHHFAWWWFGMRPILEVKNTATGECWLFQYQIFKPFDNRWLRLTPMRNADPFLGARQTFRRLKCLTGELFATAIAVGMLCGIIAALLLFILSLTPFLHWLD
jgi:hypothetical protein